MIEYEPKEATKLLLICMSYWSNMFKIISKAKTDDTQNKKLVYKTFFNHNVMMTATIVKQFTSVLKMIDHQ